MSNKVGNVALMPNMPLWALLVLEYSDWDIRCNVAFLSKQWRENTSTIYYYRFLCQRLSTERAIYVPPTPPPSESWRTLFLDLYRLRDLWKLPVDDTIAQQNFQQLTASNQFKDRFKISVFTKFRPLRPQGSKRESKLQARSGLTVSKAHKPASSSKAAAASFDQTENDKENCRNVVSMPNSDTLEENSTKRGGEITLPLHQRLAMIKLSHRIQNKREALKLLTEEGGWFRDRWVEISNDLVDAENEVSRPAPAEANMIKGAAVFTVGEKFTSSDDVDASDSDVVAVGRKSGEGKRVTKSKPVTANSLNWKVFRANVFGEEFDGSSGLKTAKSSENAMVAQVQSIDSMNGRVVMLTPEAGLREFAFDGVLPPTASQKYAYDVSVKRLVMDFINGFNATSIVYGQTGSGKTYTMFGPDKETISGQSRESREAKGIVPRVCEEILTAMTRRKEGKPAIESSLTLSYIEIYGDTITDLLRSGARCSHSKVAAQRFVLNGAVEHGVSSMEEILSLLAKGEETKRRAATAMNDRSTRAHSLFILTLRQEYPSAGQSGMKLTSKFFLADLGGSEQVKKSEVEGENLKEAIYINLGLLALKRVIESLHAKSTYMPYQDSKLTMLLSEGLGGNSKTSLICCAALEPEYSAETLATLRFGERCAQVENALSDSRGKGLLSLLESVLAGIEREGKELEEVIAQKERWELREERVVDWDEELGKEVIEVRKVTMLVGAEAERARLAQLLLQREQLCGKASYAADQAEEPTEKKVLGFGKQFAELYNIGQGYDQSLENQENKRFVEKVSATELPQVLRNKANQKVSWATGENVNERPEELATKAKKAKRTKLAFSGLSF